MIKRNITFMSAIILAMSLLIACSQEPSSFSINEQGLTQILNDKNYREDFIKSWGMTTCFKNDFSTRYCYQDSVVQLEILKEDGYILSVTGLEFLEFDDLVSELEGNYDSQDIKGLEGFEKHLGMYELSFGQYFSNKSFEIFVAVQKTDTHKNYTITVNRAGT